MQVIINGTAGGMASNESRQQLARSLEAAGISAQIEFVEPGANIRQMALQAVQNGNPMIVAGGGDGTISAVASVVAGSHTILGVLPMGTLNHFAKDLGVPADMNAAVRILADGKARKIDVGEVNGRIFVNNSGLGLYPAMVEQREREQKRGVSKWIATFWAAAKALTRYRLLTVRVATSGEHLVRITPIVFIGNNQYSMQSLNAGSRACLDAGQLSLYIPRHKKRLQLLWLSLRAILGQLREDDFDILLTQELWIATRRRHLRVTLDGEVAKLEAPLHYRIHPGALRVMAPVQGSGIKDQR